MLSNQKYCYFYQLKFNGLKSTTAKFLTLSFLLIFYLFVTSLSAVHAQVDFEKMKLDISNAKNDSVKVVLLDDIAWEYIRVNPMKGIPFIEEAIQICPSKYRKLQSSCYNTYGNLLEATGDLDMAEYYFLRSISIKKSINDMKGAATVYSNLAKIYRQKGRFNEGIKYLKASIHIHDSLNNEYGMLLAHTNLGNIYKSIGRYQESMEQQKKVLLLSKSLNDTLSMAYAYVNIGSILIDEGKYESGTQNLLKGLKILENQGDFSAQILVMGNIASAFEKVENYSTALFYLDRALRLAEKHKIYSHLPTLYQVKGEAYMGLKEYKKANSQFKNGYKYALKNDDIFLQIELIGNLGNSFEKLNRMEEAIFYYTKAIVQARKYKVKATEFKCLCNVSDLMIRQSQPEKSKLMLKRAWVLAKELNIKKIYLLYYASAIRLARMKMDATEILKVYDQYFLYRDSIMPDNIQTSMSEANVKYETEKKANQIQLLRQNEKIKNLELKAEKLQVEKRNYLISAGLLIFSIIGGYTYYAFKKEKKLSKEKRRLAIKETEAHERSRIARDIHDDLGSGLSRIRFLTEGLEKEQENEVFQKKIGAINTTAFSLVENMRDLIWGLNPENNTLENLFVRINEYTTDYLEEFPIESNVIFPSEIPEVIVSNEISRNLFSIVKEIIHNVVKHTEARKFEIFITCDSKSFTLTAKDDGKGFEAMHISKGNGLKNIRKRVEMINGEIIFNSEQGSEISIQIEYESLLSKNTTFM